MPTAQRVEYRVPRSGLYPWSAIDFSEVMRIAIAMQQEGKAAVMR
jgi:hypothetical protein